MFRGVTANAITTEIIRVLAIHACNAREHIVSMIIHSGERGVRAARLIKFERTRRISHPFVRIDFNAKRMVHCDELEPVGKQRFFQLVRHAELVAPVALFQLVAANPHVLIRIGRVVTTRLFQVPHLTAAHKICDELKALAIP